MAKYNNSQHRSQILSGLAQTIDQLEGRQSVLDSAPGNSRGVGWTTGVDAIDQHLPDGGLDSVGCHEVTAGRADEMGAALAFATALAGRFCRDHRTGADRPILWCSSADASRDHGLLHLAGLARYGLRADDLMVARARRSADVLWTMEEALRSGAIALVIGELEQMDLTASRRIALACRDQKTPALIIRPPRLITPAAVSSRWRVSPMASGASAFDPYAPGQPRWSLQLERGRAVSPKQWKVEWNDKTFCLHLVTALAHHTPSTTKPQSIRHQQPGIPGTLCRTG